MDALKVKIRHVPDFPKAGILFYDVTTLLRDPEGFRVAIDSLVEPVQGPRHQPGRRHREPRLHPRRRGRGSARRRLRAGAQGREAAVDDGEVELRSRVRQRQPRDAQDAVEPGQRVLIVDDLLATGGTARATVDLVKQLGGQVEGVAFLIELRRPRTAARACRERSCSRCCSIRKYRAMRARSSAG